MSLTMERYELSIPAGEMILPGNLVIPASHKGLVIFSNSGGSGRLNQRNQAVAQILNEKNLGTLLFDPLTKDEDDNYANRFNIQLLYQRLLDVSKWFMEASYNAGKPVAYFAAGTGAASALYAAAALGNSVKAIVSRGGRPDLALPVIKKVTAPTLLLVGSMDTQVIELNRMAYEKIETEKQLQVIEGASHVFEEPGKLEEAADAAVKWYQKYLP